MGLSNATSKWPRTLGDVLPARSDRSDRLTVRDLANEFLTFKQHMVNTGEIARRTFDEYRDTCERLIRVLGRDMPVERIQAGDLRKVREDIAKHGVSIKTLANEIGRKQVGFYAFPDAADVLAGSGRLTIRRTGLAGQAIAHSPCRIGWARHGPSVPPAVPWGNANAPGRIDPVIPVGNASTRRLGGCPAR